ncbi:uncharacterized protein LOC112126144 [Cimex lectularius]|uniref:Uncharacterized protein n=1 Tax=Cimex lectularius TaxID=79782 RepID=A0A8I6TI76_CIMLE|nr:uncharacterized protein LOC112126144 [Cimex lectularius]
MNVKVVMDFGTCERQKCRKAKRQRTGGIPLGDCEQTTSNVAASTWLVKNHLMKHQENSIHRGQKENTGVLLSSPVLLPIRLPSGRNSKQSTSASTAHSTIFIFNNQLCISQTNYVLPQTSSCMFAHFLGFTNFVTNKLK